MADGHLDSVDSDSDTDPDGVTAAGRAPGVTEILARPAASASLELSKEVLPMSDASGGFRIGHPVPDFELTTFVPETGDFGKFSLAKQKEAKRWTVLFFYPADFTFV